MSEAKRIRFITRKFAEYYERAGTGIEAPPELQRREVGFMLFGERIMIRHRAFRSMDDLMREVQVRIPSDIYYSAAYYSKPEAEMDEKGWLGADLIFDVDADHLETSCKSVHDKWVCKDCGWEGRGIPPDVCPECHKSRFDERKWVCDVCLNAAKNEIQKLIEFLTCDFGFESQEIIVVFSGNRGFHLHVRSEKVRNLDDADRKEIVDYVTGVGLDLQSHGLYKKPRDVITGPELNDPGWRGRIAKGIYQVLTNSSLDELVELGLTRRSVQQILNERERIASAWAEKMLWGEFEDRYRLSAEMWSKVVRKVIQRMALPARIDTVVTTDTHRLIRLPGTLNGKSGLKAEKIELDDLTRFDPFKNAVAFEGEETVDIEEAPRFRLGNSFYGPFKATRERLPTAAALLLACKGLANPAEQE